MKFFRKLLLAITLLGLTGCRESYRVSYNLRLDADNFNIYRRVVAINTRTAEALFSIDGYISINSDSDGDLNVLIQTDKDQYKLFYAHLSNDVTYTCVQLEPTSTTPYAYDISFFPAKEVIEHGLVDFHIDE